MTGANEVMARIAGAFFGLVLAVVLGSLSLTLVDWLDDQMWAGFAAKLINLSAFMAAALTGTCSIACLIAIPSVLFGPDPKEPQ